MAESGSDAKQEIRPVHPAQRRPTEVWASIEIIAGLFKDGFKPAMWCEGVPLDAELLHVDRRGSWVVFTFNREVGPEPILMQL